MSFDFIVPKIETRSSEKNGKPEYIIRGYATVPNHIYSYKKTPYSSFREFFSDKGIENLKRKAKNERIFVDYGHKISSNLNIMSTLNDIEKKTGLKLDKEKEYISDKFMVSDVPMFKIYDLQIDDQGLFVDIRANPYFRDLDEEHQRYFDSVWKSIEEGYINGISVNLDKPSIVATDINESLRQIDDAEILGISLIQGAACDMANITEVAMRCIEYERGARPCQKMQMIM